MARAGTLMSASVRRDIAAGKPPRGDRFVMMVDHCFPVKGHGTVLTGTVIDGAVRVGEDVSLPDLGAVRRVKGIEVFRKPVQVAFRGDRIGMCVTQLNAERLERGIACSGASTTQVLTIKTAFVAEVGKVRYYKGAVDSAATRFHLTIGHATVMATLRFFSAAAAAPSTAPTATAATATVVVPFDFSGEYKFEPSLPEAAVAQFAPRAADAQPEDPLELLTPKRRFYAVVLVDAPVTTFVGARILGAHLDGDTSANVCRLAFSGAVMSGEITPASFAAVRPPPPVEDEPWRMLRVVKLRERGLMIDKVIDPRTCLVRPARFDEAPPTQDLHQAVAAAAAAAPAAGGRGGRGGHGRGGRGSGADGPAAGHAAATPVTSSPATGGGRRPNRNVITDLSKYIGARVIFRRRHAPRAPPKPKPKGKGAAAATSAAADDADGPDQPDEATITSTTASATSAATSAPTPAVEALRPATDTRGTLQALVPQSGKGRVVFETDVFAIGARTLGNLLLLDKKFPFATAHRFEQI
jgi:hypothetical protein